MVRRRHRRRETKIKITLYMLAYHLMEKLSEMKVENMPGISSIDSMSFKNKTALIKSIADLFAKHSEKLILNFLAA